MFAARNSFLTSGGPALYMQVTTSGATETPSGNYKIAVFNGDGSFKVNSLGTNPTEGNKVEYLVVAGGGSGGSYNGGGGGGGGYLEGTGQTVTATNYTITVGGGGTSVSSSAAGNNGSDSSIGS